MVKEKYNIYCKAFKELDEILKYFPKREFEKIPESFIKFIETNMDSNYEYIVEHIDDFQNQKMMEETKVLLSVVYRDFIASTRVKQQILKMESVELLQEEKIIQEKYNPDNLFNNRQKEIVTENIQEISMIEYKKDTIFSKIKKIIKNILQFK